MRKSSGSADRIFIDNTAKIVNFIARHIKLAGFNACYPI